jgi:PAS domain S-box-containing protein
MDLSDYTLDTVNNDGELVLYRGRDRDRPGTSAHPSSVLVVMPRSEHPPVESVRMIEHEHSLRAELDAAWAVRPLELIQHDGRTVLVLEDPGGQPLEQLVGTPMEIGQFLCVAIGLAAAVRCLHGRGIIHKDLKPANVMVQPSTGQVRLMGFGIASRLPRERQSAKPPEFIAGTLAYMAPEQTGRMNRSIDSRSDLYALGVTLYEMITGTLPFTASDAMEWVHCHIAKQPLPPADRRKDVPCSVSAMITKLLAKTAEERYQTAAGLESDLRRCLTEWQTCGRIDEFPIGEQDTPGRLLIPEKLYGRQRDVETLLASFDRVVKSGTPELVLVSGYSGIGKSSVVNELHKALVPSRGLFASGKFDQYKRDIPYSTLAQAFQSLIQALLAKSEAELNSWREALGEALGPNGLLIVDLVPELKLIIGDQPPVPDLEPQDAQRRFQLVFRRFISAFARPEHPLVLFLDDLQWLDAATLDLLEDLLTRSDLQHLMLIGAYRDNEVDATHPLARKLEAIKNAGAKIQEITLAPLASEHLAQLIADTLRCEPERATPLAQLLQDKTGGNPFFALQFMSALAEDGLLTFDHDAGRWSFDLNRIHAKDYTDNVVDLMVSKLTRLPVETQAVLQQLACLGNIAEVTTFSFVHGTSEEDIHSDLWEAVLLELIVPLEGVYRFVHDRVQEAAYSLIPADLRAAAHLRIGRLLAAHTPPEKQQEAIFEIVNQLNRGAPLIAAQDEREQLAEFNLIAGKRAKASTAYASALTYVVAGAALLAEDSWERRHELTFSLELHRAECEFLTGARAEAEQRLAALSSRAATTVERATVACLRADLYMTLDQSNRAVTVCLEYLRHLDIDWSPHPTEDEARGEYEHIWSQLGGRTIEELVDLPLMSDPESLATLDVLTKLGPAAFFTDCNLWSLIVCRAINLSLERGYTDGSCPNLEWLGSVAGMQFDDYQAGSRFGQLGYDLVEKRGLKRFQARTLNNFAAGVLPWTTHVKSIRDLLHRAFEAANKIGDLFFAAFSCGNLNSNLLAAGDPLVEVQLEVERSLAFAGKIGFGYASDVYNPQLGLVRTLRGLTPKFGSFDDQELDELRLERRLSGNPELAPAESGYWIRKLQARFIAGDYAAAVAASLRAQSLPGAWQSVLETADHYFYGALSHAVFYDTALLEERQQHLEALAGYHRQIEIWAVNCPENFENRAALVSAEIARIEGRIIDAEHLYEQAIRSARANGFVHNEGVAYELAARFYAARGFEKIAHAYLRDARYCYLRWGADGKVRQLDQLYPHLREKEPAPGPTSTIGAPVENLDLATVIKVSQAVSGEIVLEKLIDTLMRAALEHAGAERGLLILPRGVEPRIEAEATTSGDTVVVRLLDASVTGAALPESIVHYVVRTRESVILDDALAQNPFSVDKYIRQHHARSILCLPLVNQTKLIGVLYLENNLTPHVFTPTRISVLKVLASQAAISLENTRLYGDLEEREAKIRRLVDANIMGIFIWNLDGKIIEANEAFLHMVGYGREDLVSGCMRWTELTPAEWLDRDERAVAELRATGTLQPFEKEFLRKDGSRVPVMIGAASFEGSGDEGVSFVLDLSEQKRAEEALRRSEAYLAEAQRLTHTGTWALDPSKLEHVYWSSEYYRIFGFDPATDRARRSAAFERVHPDDRARLDSTVREAIRGKTNFDIYFRIVLPDGTEKHLRNVAHPVIDHSGEVVEMIGTSMDVTEQYQSRAALEKAFEEIRALKDQLYKENLALRDEVDRASMFEEIVGTSTALRAVLSRIAKVAPTDSTVFITGETGTGKELIARAVHKRSKRSGRAFVSVNCAAMAPSLISSELFGHEKGAFTGAEQRRLGRFELADGGTIFLDEVGELPPDTQVALLRVLQEREFERVGGAQSIQIDVRVIAATNRDLQAAITNGTFRLDLFYRLNVFPIEVPPLRERKDDILMLLEYFVKRYGSRAGKNIRSIDKKTLELFQSYEWPGNIRELQNVIERSVIVSSGDVFSVDESWLSKESPQLASRVQASPPLEGEPREEREVIEAALAESRGRVSGPSGAAAKLRIPPSTLESRIKALKIRKSQFKF